jgi:hypothetical protein
MFVPPRVVWPFTSEPGASAIRPAPPPADPEVMFVPLLALVYSGGVVQSEDGPLSIDIETLLWQLPLALMFMHETALGEVTGVEVRRSGLIVEGAVCTAFPAGRHVVEQAKKPRRFWEASVRVRTATVDSRPVEKRVNGRVVGPDVAVAYNGQLVEVSIVDQGADSRTSVCIG